MTDLRALLERVRAARGPDLGVDQEVYNLAKDYIGYVHQAIPRYSDDVDEVSRLVDVLFQMPPAWWEINLNASPLKAVFDDGDDREFAGTGPTQALSLLNVMLQALIAKAEVEEEGEI
jgi:hypothetical protein